MRALKRLKGNSNNHKEKMISDQLTEDVNKICIQNGDYNVYNEEQEVFQREIGKYERLAQEKEKDCDMCGDEEEDTTGGVLQGVTNDGSDYVYDESSGMMGTTRKMGSRLKLLVLIERKRKDTLMLMGIMLCMLERRKITMHGLTVLKLTRCLLDYLLLMILKRKKMGGQSVVNTVRAMSIGFSVAMGIHADELSKEDFAGSKWLVLRYDVLNLEIIKTAIGFAKHEGLSVYLILACFKMAPYIEKE